MSNLRSRTIRLAHSNPELRVHLLPFLQKTAGEMTAEGLLHFFYDVKKNLKLSGETQGVANWLHTQLGKMRFSQIQQPLKDLMYGLLKLAASLSQDASQANLWQKLHETIQRVEKELPNHRLAHVSKTATTLRNVRGLFQNNAAGRYTKQTTHTYGENMSAVIRIKKYLEETCKDYVNSPEVSLLSQLDDVLNHLWSVYEDRDDLYLKPAETKRRKWDEVAVLFKKLIAYK